MTAGLEPLRHDGVTACLRYGLSLTQVRGRGKQGAARSLQRLDALRVRQAKVEADHRRGSVQQHAEHGVVVGKALVDGAQCARRFGVVGGKERAQGVAPCGLARCIRRGGCVDKEVHVEGAVRQCAGLFDHLARTIRIRGPHAEGAKPACV